MKTLFVSILLALSALLLGQSPYEEAMDKALYQLELAETQEQFLKVSNSFDQVVLDHPEKWEPLYYAILSKSIYAFWLPEPEAFELLKTIESDYTQLTALKDNDETKVLKGMYLTVKVAKDPMTYGPSLTPVIMSTYHEARKENPKNPRVLFQIAEYEISGAPYMGQDPKAFCPLLEEAITLFEEEAKVEATGYNPRWGMKRAMDLFVTTCN